MEAVKELSALRETIGALSAKLDQGKASLDDRLTDFDSKLKKFVNDETLAKALEDLKADIIKKGLPHDRQPEDGGFRYSDPDSKQIVRIGTELTTKHPNVAKWIRAVVQKDVATVKALSGDIGAQGGFLVPDELLNIFIEKEPIPNHVQSRWTVVPTSFDSGQIPRDGNAVTWSRKGQNASATESNPTLEQLKWEMKKLLGLSKMSRELVMDSMFPVVDWIVRVYTNALQELLQDEYFNGDGSDQMEGIRINPDIGTRAQVGGDLSADDMLTLKRDLKQQYRRNAVWHMAPATILLVELFKDAQDRFLWLDGLTASTPSTFSGHTVLEIDQIPTNLGAGTDESVIALGDVSRYFYFDKREYRIETTTEGGTAFVDDQMWVKLALRNDGKVALPDAYKILTGVK